MSNAILLRKVSMVVGRIQPDPSRPAEMGVMIGNKIIKVPQLGIPSNGVSRIKGPNQGGHVRIDIDENGRFKVANLNPQNRTWVNHMPVNECELPSGSRVEMGANHDYLDVERLVKYVQDEVVPTRDISHLRRTWDDYNERKLSIARTQQTIATKKGRTILFTLSGGLLGTALGGCLSLTIGPLGVGALIGVLPGILYTVYCERLQKNFNAAIEQQKLQDLMMDYYTCPKCGIFLGMQPYKMLVTRGKCPNCGCRHVEAD